MLLTSHNIFNRKKDALNINIAKNAVFMNINKTFNSPHYDDEMEMCRQVTHVHKSLSVVGAFKRNCLNKFLEHNRLKK